MIWIIATPMEVQLAQIMKAALKSSILALFRRTLPPDFLSLELIFPQQRGNKNKKIRGQVLNLPQTLDRARKRCIFVSYAS